MTDIVERLKEYAEDDHERGCQGRYYDCSCGYDGKRAPLLNEAAEEITRLRAALRSIAKTTYGYEPFMSDEEAKDYFSSLFFGAQSNARAALKEDGDDTV